MSYKIIVSPLALKNIEEAAEYYILKVSKKVGLDFLNDYKKTYKALQINHFYQVHDSNYHFFPFKKFPYIAFFIIDETSRTVFSKCCFSYFSKS